MPTPSPAEIKTINDVSKYLSANAVSKGRIFSQVPDTRLPLKLYMEGKALDWGISYSADNLQQVANYVLALDGKYGLTARAIVTGGGGGSIPVPGIPGESGSGDCTGVYKLDSSMFESDGITYLNTGWAGKDLDIYWKDINNFIDSPVQYIAVPGGGFTMLVPGFDANTTNYEFRVFIGCYSASGGGSSTAPNEIVPFTAVSSYTLAWDSTRIARFGTQGSFQVIIDNEVVTVQIVANDDDAPTSYEFTFGGTSTGSIVIS